MNTGRTKKTTYQKTSKSEKSGLMFPVARVKTMLSVHKFASRINTEGAVFLTAVLEYLVAEVLELSLNAAKASLSKRIQPNHVNIALKTDLDFEKKFVNSIIPEGTYVKVKERIQNHFMSERESKDEPMKKQEHFAKAVSAKGRNPDPLPTSSNKASKKRQVIPMSKSEKSGLMFPVARVKTMLSVHRFASRINNDGAVFLTAVLEYLTAEILELSLKAAGTSLSKRIQPKHVNIALKTDMDFEKKFRNCTIRGAGYLNVKEWIQKHLMVAETSNSDPSATSSNKASKKRQGIPKNRNKPKISLKE